MGNEVRVRTSVDDKVTTPLKQIETRFESLGKKAGAAIGGDSQMAKGIGLAAATGGLLALGAAASVAGEFIGDSIGAASDLNETLQKSQVVFGKDADGVKAFGETAARSMGMSEDAAISAAASIGNLLLSTGTAKEKIAPMSEGIVKLASDLASFNNIPMEDALAKLQSGLVGQERPLRELGVAISAASVDAKAAALGFHKMNGEFSEGEKVQARYALIFDQTGTAQGDFARTSDGLANSSRILNSELADLSAEVGEVLIPFMEKAVHVIADDLIPNIKKAAGPISDLIGFIGNGIGTIAAPITLITGAVRDLTGTADEAATGLDRFAGKAKDDVYVAAKAIGIGAGKIDGSLSDIGDQAHDTRAEFNKLTGAVNTAADALAGAVYGPAQLKGEIAKLNDALIDDVKHLHDVEKIKNPTAAQRRDIMETKGRIAETNAALLKTKVDLATLNGTGLGALRGQLEKLARQTGAAGDEARALLAALLAVRLAQIGKMPSGGGGAKRRAGGGPVSAGQTYLVGEKGPELFTPNSSGGITPNNALSSSGGTPMVPTTIHVHLLLQKRGLREIAEAVVDLGSYGRGNPTFAPS